MVDFADPTTADDWLFKGASALADFWLPREKCFLRATGPSLVKPNSGPTRRFSATTGATSSNRSFLTLTEVLFFLLEERRYRLPWHLDGSGTAVNDRWQELGDRLEHQWREMAIDYYGVDIQELREHSDNDKNDFTDCHLLISCSLLLSRFAQHHMKLAPSLDRAKFSRVVRAFEQRVEQRGGARIAGSGPTHPMLTLHAIRAIETSRHVSGRTSGRSRVTDELEAEVRRSARDDLFRQLGMHASQDAEFDPSALLGDVGLLHRFAGMSGRHLVEKGIELLGETQGLDGSWKTQILTGNKKLVYLPSLELAVNLANVVLADLNEGSDRLAKMAEPILARSLSFLESGYSESPSVNGIPGAGWSNDQARQANVVESWSTALALQLMLRVRRISRRVLQHQVVTRYRTTARDRLHQEWLRWPDLAGPIQLVRSQDEESARARRELRRISDPSRTAAVDRSVWKDVVEPILHDPFDRPSRTTSFVLYGPPGTRKSSMVSAVAAALDWPLVTLAPPDFLTTGMAGLEARAEEIFRDLLELRRVVVFFDECEELFRRRTVVNSPEHRTQSDFITSGMLPRLQDLREQRWVVFVIATNTELDEIDPAVVRYGRIDGQQRIGHPHLDAQIRYVRSSASAASLSARSLANLLSALKDYDKYLEHDHMPCSRKQLMDEREDASALYRKTGDLQHYFRTADYVRAREAEMPLVSFGALDELVKRLKRESGPLSREEIYGELSRITLSRGRPPQWTELDSEAGLR